MVKSVKTILKQRLSSAEQQKIFQNYYQQIINDPEINDFLKKNFGANQEIDLEHNFSKLYEYFLEKKLYLANSKDYIAQGYVPKLTVNNSLIDVIYEPSAKLLQAQAQAKLKACVRARSIPKDVQDASLNNLVVTDNQERLKAITLAINFANNLTKNPSQFQKGIYLYGSFGVGKTYLMYALANKLAESQINTVIIHFPSFILDLKNWLGKPQFSAKIDELKLAQNLILDDLGAETTTSWVRDEILLNILQYRMQEKLITSFTSNRDFASLNEHLSVDNKGNVEKIQAARVMERVKYLAQEVFYGGENLRNKTE